MASCLSECASIRVASRSITTHPSCRGAPAVSHTRSRAAARAEVIAASAASLSPARVVICRDMGRTPLAARATPRHRRPRPRPAPLRLPDPARSSPDHGWPAACARVRAAATAHGPTRCAAPSPPATRHRRATPATHPPGDGRRPTSSVNMITAHDGFTLADLVSYDRKHNEANGEANGTAPTTTGRVTAVTKALPSTARSWPCAPARAGPCSPRCCCRPEFR